MVVSQGDATGAQPPRCPTLGNCEGAPAYRRLAFCICSRLGGGVCSRQHWSLPRPRLAAIAARGLFGLLVAFLVLRIASVVSHFLLAPDHDRFRIIPMDTAAARFWHRRLVWFVGWFAFGWVIVGFGVPLGYTLAARQLVAYALGLVLVAIALDAVWRRPTAIHGDNGAPSPVAHRFGRGTANTALSVGIVLLWVFWVIHAMASFWLVLVVMALPLAISLARRAVDNLLRPPGSTQAADGPPSVL